ncbi:MAG: hypothetical protein ACKO2G_00895 [Verrucomicrobiales bacterium]
MNEAFQALSAICALLAMLVGIPAWAASLYYLIRTSRSTIHADSAWQRPNSILVFFRWQPFSPVFDATQLTPQGLVYRRRLVFSVLLFSVPILAAFLFRALAR